MAVDVVCGGAVVNGALGGAESGTVSVVANTVEASVGKLVGLVIVVMLGLAGLFNVTVTSTPGETEMTMGNPDAAAAPIRCNEGSTPASVT